MRKTLGILFLLVGASTAAMASQSVPEIDGGSAVAALALVSGGLLILRARRK